MQKFNHNHDRLGRFSSGSGGGGQMEPNEGRATRGAANSGALSGAESGAHNDANDPYQEKRDEIAANLYDQYRRRKKGPEIAAVARNSGFSEDDISRIYSHIFEREHLMGGKIKRFDPDYYMAHSWRRLREGHDIQPHDLVMLHHERIEEQIMGDSLTIPYETAHEEAERQYSYRKALMEYLKTHDV